MTNPDERPSPSHAEGRASPWIAFRQRAFTVVWIATVVANVGTWMYNAASGWLMTSLNSDPLTVSLVQVAGSLPMFLFALPAGALADTVDKRRFLIGAEIVLTVVAAASAVLVWLDLVTPSILLLFTFLLGAGAAFTPPALQSLVPQLVPKHDLAAALSRNAFPSYITPALVATYQFGGGPGPFGIVLGAIGPGAVVGAFTPPSMKAAVGSDRLVAAGTLGTALSLVLLGIARHSAIGIAACAAAGVSWIAVLASLNVSVQMSLPDWVRGRGLAMFVTVFFGAMTAGSALWGQLASALGLPAAHFIAAAGALVGIAATWHWKLLSGAGVDLAPSMHWPVPILAIDADVDRGPVLVTVEYRVAPEKRDAFLVAVRHLGQQRQRDGAYAWDVFVDAAENGRFLETFMVTSWLEHLRQHHRVTNADRIVQDAIREFGAVAEPQCTPFLA